MACVFSNKIEKLWTIQLGIIQKQFFSHGVSLPFIHCFGSEFTRIQTLIKAILSVSEAPHCVVDCIEACNVPKLLFESILRNLSRFRTTSEQPPSNTEDRIRCETAQSFIKEFHNLIAKRKWEKIPVTIIFAQAERLRLFPATVLAFIGKLQELTNHTVNIVTISRFPYSKFYSSPLGFVVPLQIYFPNFTREEIVEIISERVPTDTKPEEYKSFCNILAQLLHSSCRNVSEYEYLANKIWGHIQARRKANDGARSENGNLKPRFIWNELKAISGVIFESLFTRTTVYQFQIDSDSNSTLKGEREGSEQPEWQPEYEECVSQSGSTSKDDQPKEKQRPLPDKLNAANKTSIILVEMPKFRKLVLVASYLASYNSPKSDEKFFWKGSKKQRKSRTLAGLKKDGKSAHVVGPHAFVLPRIWPICRHLMNELDLKGTAADLSIRTQIVSLVGSGMVSRTSAPGNLEVPKFRCVANYNFVEAVAKSMDFRLINYLQDFMY